MGVKTSGGILYINEREITFREIIISWFISIVNLQFITVINKS
jgi:hypothetical protein